MKGIRKSASLPASPSRTFLREEKVDGAVYEVSLKKVRYRSSDRFPSEEDEVSHLQWETIRICKIKAGTLEKLVENLAPCKAPLEELDPGYVLAFLSTYRAFAKVEEVLELLLKRYVEYKGRKEECPEISERVQRGVVAVLLVWLEQFSSDFNDPPEFQTLKRILGFVRTEISNHVCGELEKKVQHKIDMFAITPYEGEGSPIPFRLSLVKDVDFVVEAVEKLTAENTEESGTNLLSIEPEKFAEQLTIMDAELFRKVIAWHCMGSVWSRRKRSHKPAFTVQATVDQFNAVSLKVLSSILKTPENKSPAQRGRYINQWINIAQCCRNLKNFSSLKAIISALQSASIHRLKKSWQHVPRESTALFNELASLCSEEKNQQMSRDVLNKEGTAKWTTAADPGHKKPLRKRRSRFMEMGVIQGTVPYLGTFLTDLMMLDTIHHDLTEDGYINFDKRRKEFEIIAQIKLFQEAAKNYTLLTPDDNFRHWFDNITTLTERESFELSCKLEKDSVKKRGSGRFKLRRNQSDPDISKLSLSPPENHLSRLGSKSTEVSPVLHRHSRNNSNSSSSSTSSGISSGSETASAKSLTLPRDHRPSSPCLRAPLVGSPQSARQKAMHRLTLSLPLPGSSPREYETGHIIRVSLESSSSTGVMYKGVWLTDEERTPKVIRTSLAKHDIEADPADYCLVQQLDNGNELVLPDYCNVYYAMNSSVEPLTFHLRKKTKTER
ncbi:ral guanine nucleotide dissociation stimulator [Nematostella vectensis]|uniref:ral guanine nucleotide dissociation stimulator n=1 Tax=Nematostella vectensis TaxID=45351 RepID=UPI00207722D9|nr:ral guanine nucleotide dissociation stimulator [Nematostella vectensis]